MAVEYSRLPHGRMDGLFQEHRQAGHADPLEGHPGARRADRRGGRQVRLCTTTRGTTVTAKDFEPLAAELPMGKQLPLTPSRGRRAAASGRISISSAATAAESSSSAGRASGRSRSTARPDTAVRVTAGQELVNAKLLPGEEIRTPLIVLQFYRGDVTRAQNIWRRWMLAHNLPRPGGKLPPPQMTPCSSHQFAEMTKADEASQKLFVDRYRRRGNQARLLVDGRRLVSVRAASGRRPAPGKSTRRDSRTGCARSATTPDEKGVKTIVWFEPERVVAGHVAPRQPPGVAAGRTRC